MAATELLRSEAESTTLETGLADSSASEALAVRQRVEGARATALLGDEENGAAEYSPTFPRASIETVRADRPRVEVLQRWSGVITELEDGAFRADIRDLQDPKAPLEEVVLAVDEVPPADRPLVQRGAMFYWHLGYEHDAQGSMKRYIEIRFRRLRKEIATPPRRRFSSLFA
jgi:hypothetical protein